MSILVIGSTGTIGTQVIEQIARRGVEVHALIHNGSGEGADAIWLAGRGWQVTAVISDGDVEQPAQGREFRADRRRCNRVAYASGSRPLDTGDLFPSLSITTTDGSNLTLPKPGRWTIFVIYRGEW